MKKLISLVLALAMILMVGAAFATAATGTITITPPTGLEADSTNTYSVYKVFDAVYGGENAISYTVASGKTGVPNVAAQVGDSYNAATTPHFILDAQGNVHYGTEDNEGNITDDKSGELSAAAIKAIAAYVNGDNPVATATSDGGADATATVPLDGYYFISTTTGTAVTITSTRPHESVIDKNEVPPMDKTITGANSIDDAGKKAIAQVGTNVTYTVTVTKKAGAENYIVYDTMGAGLKYNKDAKVYIGEDEIVNADGATKYTKTQETDTALTLSFDNTWIASLADDTVIKVVYTALVTEDALHTNPAKNTAHLEFGHTPGSNKTPNKQTETYNATVSVLKKNGAGDNLAGAGFVLKNSENKYYKYTAATGTTPETIEWVDSIDSATQYVSGADGKLDGSFSGLANGSYTLVEKTVPAGYNKAADTPVTIAAKDFTADNLLQEYTVINNSGTELPSTGGIGTTIFYAVGGLLLVGAAIILVARRKANN